MAILLDRVLSSKAVQENLADVVRFMNRELIPLVSQMRTRLQEVLVGRLTGYAQGSEPDLSGRPEGERAAVIMNTTTSRMRWTADGITWHDV